MADRAAAPAQKKSPCLRAEKGERCRGLISSASFHAGSPLVKKVRRLHNLNNKIRANALLKATDTFTISILQAQPNALIPQFAPA
jgi:hypothetical protein